MTEPRRRGRPPRPGGPKLNTSIRVDKDVWDEAHAVAKRRHERLAEVIERYLGRYIAADKRNRPPE